MPSRGRLPCGQGNAASIFHPRVATAQPLQAPPLEGGRSGSHTRNFFARGEARAWAPGTTQMPGQKGTLALRSTPPPRGRLHRLAWHRPHAPRLAPCAAGRRARNGAYNPSRTEEAVGCQEHGEAGAGQETGRSGSP